MKVLKIAILASFTMQQRAVNNYIVEVKNESRSKATMPKMSE
jgi:hypothetical protein